VHGFYVENNTFKNCVVGVRFVEKENEAKNWRLLNNDYDNQKRDGDGGYPDGRFFFGQTTSLTHGFSDIRIMNNSIRNCLLHGIGFTATGDVEVSGNSIELCGRNGIYIYGGADVVVSGNRCKHNNLRGETGRADIVVGANPNTPSKDVLVSGNIVETMIADGFTSGVLVTNNIAEEDITNNNPTGVDVKNNMIAGVWTP
jgi:parallel beta-helix repeat protein